MRNTKKIIEQIASEAQEEKTVVELIIEEAKKNGFKRVGVNSWLFSIDTADKTYSYIALKKIEGHSNSIEIECFYKGERVKRRIMPTCVSDFDSIVASCMKDVKNKKGK